jgi:hypothetical protein
VGLGAFVVGMDETEISNPMIADEKGKLAYDAREGGVPMLGAEGLQKSWGPPDAVSRLEDGRELWRYDFGWRWGGAVALVGVWPIPVFVPVGRECVEFVFDDGMAIRATTREHNFVAGCGCVALVYGKGTCWCGEHDNRRSRFYHLPHKPPFRPRTY